MSRQMSVWHAAGLSVQFSAEMVISAMQSIQKNLQHRPLHSICRQAFEYTRGIFEITRQLAQQLSVVVQQQLLQNQMCQMDMLTGRGSLAAYLV